MKAIRQYHFGGPEQLVYEEVPDPTPAAGQVRISVEASGVHLVDTTIRAGTSFGALSRPALPMTPGREVAGVVDGLGADTDQTWLDKRVVVHLGAASGGYASSAVAGTSDLFVLPDHVTAADAVAMVGTGRTALGILEVAAPRSDDVVVVTAAAGGVGALLVQAAKTAGATVIATAGGAGQGSVVKRLGADAVIDHRAEHWPDAVRAAAAERPITLALDGVGGATGRGRLRTRRARWPDDRVRLGVGRADAVRRRGSLQHWRDGCRRNRPPSRRPAWWHPRPLGGGPR